MQPYQDSLADTAQGIHDALNSKPGPGGCLILAMAGKQLAGALVVLGTGMTGYIPPRLILFVSVAPAHRRKGIATELMRRALVDSPGPVKLHVESDNPARLLYESLGFKAKYLDMRHPGGLS